MSPSYDTVPREAQERLDRYAALVIAENEHQNLIASSTIASFRSRHVDDALQLLPFLKGDSLLDIGSGAGVPGLVLACAAPISVTLVEPRRRRADFLRTAVEALGLSDRVVVRAMRVERLETFAPSTVTARAVASLSNIFAATEHLASAPPRYVLPKGRSARIELEEALETWQGEFRLVESATDPAASIVIAEYVRRRR